MKDVKISFLRMIDHFLLDQVEVFKDSPTFQKLLEKYNILEDHQQKIVNAVLMLTSIAVPLLFILIFYTYNSSIKDELIIRDNIIKTASTLIAKRNQMNSYSRKVFTSGLSSQSSFTNKITTLLNTKQIDTSKIQISDFKMSEEQGISESHAKLTFKGLSDNNLFDLIEKLFVDNLFKIKNINIEKNKITKLLDGNFDLSAFDKQSVQND